jgi:hypothetical protein
MGLYLCVFLAGSLLSLFAARSLSASGPAFLLLCGGVFRATLLLRAPDLSDDVHRYLWDARVAEAGISPYAFAPRDPALDGVAPELEPRVAHPDIPTVYPPAAQAAFRALGGSRGGLIPLKALFSAADLVIVLLLCRSGGGNRFAAALYAFHPLPITETAGQGHLDSLGVALLLASLAYLGSRRPLAAGLAYALSVLTKYLSLAAVFPLLRRGRLRFLASFSITIAAIWLAASRGASPAGGLGQYATRWDFNSLLYPALVQGMDRLDLPTRAKGAFLDLKERLDHPAWTQSVFPFFYSEFFARAALGLLLLVSLILVARRWRDPEPAVFASLAALLLLSPTLHPWYLLWVLPFAALRREPAFLYLSFAVPVSYLLLYPVPGFPRALVYAVEYVPFLLLLARTLFLPLPPRRRRGVPPRLTSAPAAAEGRAEQSERPAGRGEGIP